MVNAAEAQSPADEGWVVEVMASSGQPVTHWLVVGPVYYTGPNTDRRGVPDWMFDDEKEALDCAREIAEGCPFYAKVVVYPPRPFD